jgi:predicted NAD-dependent protein-ADP-ribosyltransferase YbiA (DUF1768 family)
MPGRSEFLQARVALIRAPDQLAPLANMTRGYPLRVGAAEIATSEHLYQASKVPNPQRGLIVAAATGHQAKAAAYTLTEWWREDWTDIRVSVMEWCLAVKLTQHWNAIAPVLAGTGGLPIVEWSRRDDFWGAVPGEPGTLVGYNILGKLWDRLRDIAAEGDAARVTTAVPYELAGDWTWPAR